MRREVEFSQNIFDKFCTCTTNIFNNIENYNMQYIFGIESVGKDKYKLYREIWRENDSSTKCNIPCARSINRDYWIISFNSFFVPIFSFIICYV